jgi:hypothetical protein
VNQTRWNEPWADDESQDDTPAAAGRGALRPKRWKLRYDAATLPPQGESLPDVDVLSFFRKQLRPDVRDGERLGWWEDEEFLIAPVELDNISRGGVRLTTTKPIRVDQSCWLCLGPPSPVVCVRSVVVGVSRGRTGLDVRLAFTMPCPDQFYEIVVNGREPGEGPAGRV